MASCKEPPAWQGCPGKQPGAYTTGNNQASWVSPQPRAQRWTLLRGSIAQPCPAETGPDPGWLLGSGDPRTYRGAPHGAGAPLTGHPRQTPWQQGAVVGQGPGPQPRRPPGGCDLRLHSSLSGRQLGSAPAGKIGVLQKPPPSVQEPEVLRRVFLELLLPLSPSPSGLRSSTLDASRPHAQLHPKRSLWPEARASREQAVRPREPPAWL